MLWSGILVGVCAAIGLFVSLYIRVIARKPVKQAASSWEDCEPVSVMD